MPAGMQRTEDRTMSARGPHPSPDQWASLDAALERLHERPAPGAVPSLTREVARRADALRAAMASGWRIADLAEFFRECAGINVSPGTIRTALRQALDDATSGSGRGRAKRPRKKTSTSKVSAPKALTSPQTAARPSTSLPRATTSTFQPVQGGVPSVTSPVSGVPGAPDTVPTTRHDGISMLGTARTQGATKRGLR